MYLHTYAEERIEFEGLICGRGSCKVLSKSSPPDRADFQTDKVLNGSLDGSQGCPSLRGWALSPRVSG